MTSYSAALAHQFRLSKRKDMVPRIGFDEDHFWTNIRINLGVIWSPSDMYAQLSSVRSFYRIGSSYSPSSVRSFQSCGLFSSSSPSCISSSKTRSSVLTSGLAMFRRFRHSLYAGISIAMDRYPYDIVLCCSRSPVPLEQEKGHGATNWFRR